MKENVMKTNGLIAVALAACFALSGLHGAALAQPKAKAPAKAPIHEPMKMTIKGKILKDKSMGGYYIRGVTEVYIIANQNPKVLEPLVKSGKTVTIIAKPNGDILTIEKLNGKKYQGKQAPVFK
jgi:hypothetical protein